MRTATGSLCIGKWIVDPERIRLGIFEIEDSLPDLSDPATRGCVLQLVREAWGAPGASSGQTRTRDWSVGGIAAGDSDPSWFGWGRTEAEALVAALLAAPPRVPN